MCENTNDLSTIEIGVVGHCIIAVASASIREFDKTAPVFSVLSNLNGIISNLNGILRVVDTKADIGLAIILLLVAVSVTGESLKLLLLLLLDVKQCKDKDKQKEKQKHSKTKLKMGNDTDAYDTSPGARSDSGSSCDKTDGDGSIQGDTDKLLGVKDGNTQGPTG